MINYPSLSLYIYIYIYTYCVCKVVRLLAEAGADVDRATADGFTPLLVAAQEGHAQCVGLLCGAGASACVPRKLVGGAGFTGPK